MENERKPKRIHLSAGRRELLDIVKTCRAVENREFNPFLLDVRQAIEILRRYFPHWEDLDDYCLDAQTLNELSKVIKLQNTQLRFQSSSLYADPEFLERKFERLSVKRLAEIFVKCWHPTVELEQLTLATVEEALDYWTNLLPVEERWRRLQLGRSSQPQTVEVAEALRLGFTSTEGFMKMLEEVWSEMKNEYSKSGEVDYWKFALRDSYRETVRRAYLVSFLLTYGYARMLVKKNGRMFLEPYETQKVEEDRHMISFPISIGVERWKEWKEKA